MYKDWKTRSKEAFNRARVLIENGNEDEMAGRLFRLNKEIQEEKNYIENMLEVCALVYIAERKQDE